MWICIGPFDSDVAGVVNFQKSKFLKPATEYILGRKDRALRINHKQISHDHISLTVGEYSTEDTENPDAKPSLTIHNLGSKPRRLVRGSEDIIMNPHTVHELEDGDVIQVLNGIHMSVKWENVCCLYPPPRDASAFKLRDCTKLGLSVVLTPHPSVTHHLTPTYSLTPSIAASLLSAAHFVKPDWLTTLIKSGTSSDGPSHLELTFSLPRVAEFRPEYSPSVPSTLRNHRTWEPNEARLNMFKDHRFLFVGEKGREVTTELRELVKRGGGEYECCAVEGGRTALHSVLAKGKGKGKALVLIADEPAMGAAIGQAGWLELVQEAADFSLRFVRPEKLTQAVVHVDFSYIDCVVESQIDVHRFSPPLPDVIPNTHIEEPTIAPQTMAFPLPVREPSPPPSQPSPPRKPLVRRFARKATSRAPSNPPIEMPAPESSTSKVIHPSEDKPINGDVPEPPAVDVERQRSRLVRRVKAKPMILGVDDPSVLIDRSSSTPSRQVSPAPPQSILELASTQSRVTRLKRRFGTQQQHSATTQRSVIPVIDESSEEPPLKKFKNLFEASDPDKVAQSSAEEYRNMYQPDEPQSPTQPESMSGLESTGIGAGSSSRATGGLEVVPEEQEESGTQTQLRTGALGSQRLKRKAGANGDGDVEMGDEEPARNKRRAVEGVGVVALTQASSVLNAQTKPPSTTNALKPSSSKTQASRPNSAVTNTPAAANSAQPTKLDKDAAFLKAVASTKRGKKHEDNFDREFNRLRISKPEEFGYDGDIRGNFMVIPMDVPEKKEGDASFYRRGDSEGMRKDWVGKPDFKKFKKKAVGERSRPVELYVEDESGYSQLWTGGTQTFTPAENKGKKPKSSSSLAGGPRASQRRNIRPVMDVDGIPPPVMVRSKRSATPGSSSKPATGTKAGSVKPSSSRLKPSSRAAIVNTAKPDSTSSSRAARSTAGKTAAKKATKSTKTPLFMESDEEENFAKELDAVSEEDEDEYMENGGDDGGATLRTNGRRTQDTRSTTKTKPAAGRKVGTKKAPAVMDDSSDDGVKFKQPELKNVKSKDGIYWDRS